MDCQGTKDLKHSSVTLDTLITYISLQLSNVQIINLKSQMNSEDVSRLEVSIHGSPKMLYGTSMYTCAAWAAETSIYLKTSQNHFERSLATEQYFISWLK